MARPELKTHWEEALKQHRQEPIKQDGFLTDEALQQRQTQRNVIRDERLALEEKERAKAVLDNWKTSDTEKRTITAKQQAKHTRYEQELRERYPGLFPTPAPKKST
jgi:hypothetical protein